MKSLLLKTFQGIAAGAALLAIPLFGMDHAFQLKIPFNFVAGSHQFQAGAYTINSDVTSGSVLIRSDEKGPAAFILTHSAGENKDYGYVRLVFHRYGNQNFLSQVWPAGAYGHQLNQSRKELEMAKAASRPEVLSVVASGPRKPQP